MGIQRDILHNMFVITYFLKREFNEFIKQFELTEMEAKFLIFIGKGHNETSELINHFKKHKSTIRQKTKALEEKKFIVIQQNPNDKRERHITLTKKGTAFFTKVQALEKKYHQEVFTHFSEAEKEKFLSLLNKINTTIESDHENIC